MKRLINYFLLFTLIGSVTFTSCKKDDDTPNPDMLIESIMSGTTDLYGATAATGVSVTENIVVEFSTTVDAATLSAITLSQGNNDIAIAVSASGSTVTIDPTDPLFRGTNFDLEI